jgi:hypothetical protein
MGQGCNTVQHLTEAAGHTVQSLIDCTGRKVDSTRWRSVDLSRAVRVFQFQFQFQSCKVLPEGPTGLG